MRKIKVYRWSNLFGGLIGLAAAGYLIWRYPVTSIHPAIIIAGIIFIATLVGLNLYCAFRLTSQAKEVKKNREHQE